MRETHTTQPKATLPETSDGLYPPSHRCLHICPNAYNGHVDQFAYRQCASRCALHQNHPRPQNRAKRYDKHTVCEKKRPLWQVFRQLLIGWAFLPPFSLFFCFGGELYLERAGAIYARPLGKGLQSTSEFSKALTLPWVQGLYSHWGASIHKL